jgi:hypothetical protein
MSRPGLDPLGTPVLGVDDCRKLKASAIPSTRENAGNRQLSPPPSSGQGCRSQQLRYCRIEKPQSGPTTNVPRGQGAVPRARHHPPPVRRHRHRTVPHVARQRRLRLPRVQVTHLQRPVSSDPDSRCPRHRLPRGWSPRGRHCPGPPRARPCARGASGGPLLPPQSGRPNAFRVGP